MNEESNFSSNPCDHIEELGEIDIVHEYLDV